MANSSNFIIDNSGYLSATTQKKEYSLKLNFFEMLPLISYSDEIIETTKIDIGKSYTCNTRLNNEDYSYICSVQSPITHDVLDIYYNNKVKILFIMPSLIWANKISNINQQEDIYNYCLIIGYKGLDLNKNSELSVLSKFNQLTIDGLYNFNEISTAPSITPTVSVHMFSGLRIPINSSMHRIKFDNSPITITEKKLAVVIKLGDVSMFNNDNVSIFKHYTTSLSSNGNIKFIGSSKNIENASIYITLYF